MPMYANGLYHPWAVNTVNALTGFQGITDTVNQNIPWLFTFWLITLYIVFMILYSQRPGRKKYVYITFIWVIAGMIFELFGLISPTVAAGCVAIFGFVLFFVVAGSGTD